MLNIIKKIVYTGIVTEDQSAVVRPDRLRGRLETDGSDSCGSCRTCVEACPVKAVSGSGRDIIIDHKACIFCGRCVEVCQSNSLRHTRDCDLAELAERGESALGRTLQERIKKLFRRSLHIRHVDAGSCNACDFEMNALSNPIYDLQQYGLDFVASPRHADLLMVTGVVTRNLTQALLMTYEATPAPKVVMAVGACAAGGKVFTPTYAQRGRVDELVPVDIYVPGCPPRPEALLYGLLLAMEKF